MIWQALFLLALILLNGFFAMSELAIVSAKRARLQAMAEAGNGGARRALALAEDPTTFLSTVQVGITLIGIFAGAYGGATLATPLGAALRGLPLVGARPETVALVLVVVTVTYLSLIIGELVPKRLALQNPEAIAAFVAGPMGVLAAIGKPVVWLLTRSTQAVLALLRIREAGGTPVTEEEVRAMIAEGTSVGVFHEDEQRMLEGVLRVADRPVRTIMVPRHEVAWLDAEAPVETVFEAMTAHGHSRYPLCAGDLDKVIGVVHVKDALDLWRRGGRDLAEVATEPLYVSEGILSLRLIELFRGARVHLALVIDEYGGLEGLVTPTDILATIAGGLHGDGEDAPGAVRREDGSWLMDASLPLDRAAEVLGLKRLEAVDYATLAGLVLSRLGHIPEPGESISAEGWCFEVVDLDGRRIDKLLVRRVEAAEDAAPAP